MPSFADDPAQSLRLLMAKRVHTGQRIRPQARLDSGQNVLLKMLALLLELGPDGGGGLVHGLGVAGRDLDDVEAELGLDGLAELVHGQRGHGLAELGDEAADLVGGQTAQIPSPRRAALVRRAGPGHGREVLARHDAGPGLIGLVLGRQQYVAHARLLELIAVGVVEGAYGRVVDLGRRQGQAEGGDLGRPAHDGVAVEAGEGGELPGVVEGALGLGEGRGQVQGEVTAQDLAVSLALPSTDTCCWSVWT